MVDVLTGLIDKQDNFEIVRDQIAQILADEQANQVALATTAGKPDPQEWALKIFTERSNPVEDFREGTNYTPVVNVWYENSIFPKGAGSTVDKQKSTTVYNIDIYGSAAADDDAAFTAQRAVRLVRNTLMASLNTYLQLRGLVWLRWPQSIQQFQPAIGDNAAPQVVAIRFPLEVGFYETTTLRDTGTLDIIHIDIKRAEDGSILASAEFDYT
jgi:hypothetical protein